jgi:hypothetical protein
MTQDIQAKLDLIKLPAQQTIEAADAIPALVDAAVAEFGASEFKRGQDSIILPPATNPDGTVNEDLKYTQANMDDLAAQVRLENKEQVDALNAQITELSAKLQGAVDAAAGEQGRIDAAVANTKRDIGQKIMAVEVDNTDLANSLLATP